MNIVQLSEDNEHQLESWYIVKHLDGHCEVLSVPALKSEAKDPEQEPANLERWGPFTSQNDAIARRVGLIRAGKCRPV
jgi:hypothetical protein